MNWLTPWTGVILAAALVPPLILLYFLKLRRRPQPIATTLLWRKAIEDLRANAPFQKLRRSLLLLLQLLAILLLAFSVMQPRIQAGGSRGGRNIFLIDNSASMTATDVDEEGDTRLDDAKRRAKERIEALYGGGLFSGTPGETMVVAFSDRVEVACRFSSSKQELLSSIDRIRPTHGGSKLGEALKLARAYATNVDPETNNPIGAPAALELFSDGRLEDLSEQVLRGETLTYHRIGAGTTNNVAVSAIDVERPYDRPSAVEVFAALLNFNQDTVTCDVQLSVDDAARAVEEIALPAATIDPATGRLVPGRQSVVFTPFDQPRGAVIEVANLRPDVLAADDAGRQVVPPPKRLAVGLVPPSSYFVRKVLEGMSLRELDLLTMEQFELLADNGGLDVYDVVVFEGVAPPEGKLPPGRYLSFGPTPPVEGLNEFGDGESQIVLNVRDEHPILRFVNFDDLVVPRSTLLQPGDDVNVLVEGSKGPLMVGVSRGATHHVHVAFEPGATNWPLLRSWVTFLFNAIEYLGHIGEGLTERGVEVGAAITARLPKSATDIELRTPDGGVETLAPADPSMLSWGPVRLAGLYLMSWEQPGESETRGARAYAVNLDAEFEGDISSSEKLTIGQREVAGMSSDASGYTPLWPWAIGFCLFVLMLEWWVYHRKIWV